MTPSTAYPDNDQRQLGADGRIRRYGVLGVLGIALALLIGYGIATRIGDARSGSADGPAAALADPTMEPSESAPPTDEPGEPTASAEVRQVIDAFLLRIGKSQSVDVLREQPMMSPNSPLVASTYFRVDGYDVYVYTGQAGTRRVVEYGVGGWQPHETPPAVPTSAAEALRDGEMLDLAQQLVLNEAGLSAVELDALEFNVSNKGTDATFFRWTDTEFTLSDKPEVDGSVPPPMAQVGMTRDGFVFNYTNYLGIQSTTD